MSKDKKDDAEVKAAVEDIKKAPTDADKIAELTDDLKRLQAEFENYKKRVERDNAKLCVYSKADLIKKLLPVLDSFGIALQNTNNHAEFVKGIELIFAQLHSILGDEGLRPIETKDRKFDPYTDEVLLSEPSEKPDNTILEELQRGYRFNEFVLRHSKVKISKRQ